MEGCNLADTFPWLALGGRHQRQQPQLWLLGMRRVLKWAAEVLKSFLSRPFDSVVQSMGRHVLRDILETLDSFFLIRRSHSVSFTRAQGIPKYKIGLGGGKDGKAGVGLVEGGGGDRYLAWPLCLECRLAGVGALPFTLTDVVHCCRVLPVVAQEALAVHSLPVVPHALTTYSAYSTCLTIGVAGVKLLPLLAPHITNDGELASLCEVLRNDVAQWPPQARPAPLSVHKAAAALELQRVVGYERLLTLLLLAFNNI